MTSLSKIAITTAIFFWSSAFVGIRFALTDYSPEGLALLRFIIASICIGIVYFRSPNRSRIPLRDVFALMTVGAFGIGIYNIALNYGELTVSSAIASFITSQGPLVTTCLAILFLGETINVYRILGFFVSLMGITLILLGEQTQMNWNNGIFYLFISTLAGGSYSVLQKPFLKRYQPIETTTYVIWGATAFLAFYFPQMQQDLMHASIKSTLSVVYLGIFPAAIAYVAWTYALSKSPATHVVVFLYGMPLVTTVLGWMLLSEVPASLSLLGGLIAIVGVGIVQLFGVTTPKKQIIEESVS